MKKFFLALSLVFLCALPPALAGEKPPQELFRLVTTTAQLMHRGECKYWNRDDIMCLIYFDEKREIIYLVFFDNMVNVTHVLALDKDKKETVLWKAPGV